MNYSNKEICAVYSIPIIHSSFYCMLLFFLVFYYINFTIPPTGKIDNADSGIVETSTNANVIYVDQEPDWGEILVYEALFSGSDKKAVATRMYFKALDPGVEMDGDFFSAATGRL